MIGQISSDRQHPLHDAVQPIGAFVPFLVFLKSFEVLLYEVMSWLVFYPRTLWRSVRHPLMMMKRTESELHLASAKQFVDVVSPPIFLLLTVIAANAFEVGIVGNNALIDDGVGLAAMITDNTSLILFRLVAFALLPVIAGVCALRVMHKPVDRDTLKPVFYAQCFATTPVVLLCSVAATLTRLPEPEANFPAGVMFVAAAMFFVGVEASWITREAKQPPLVGFVWAVAALGLSALMVGASILLFAAV